MPERKFMNAPANPKPRPNPLQDRQEAIRRRESAQGRTRKTAIVLRVSGEYIGEYIAESSDGYSPAEFGRGASVPVRFYGDKMFLKRANGRILESKIVKIR